MAEITSREEFENWLNDKPAGWAQLLAARMALRVLSIGLHNSFDENQWNDDFPLSLFRALSVAWAVTNFPEHNMAQAASVAASNKRLYELNRACAAAGFAADASVCPISHAQRAHSSDVYAAAHTTLYSSVLAVAEYAATSVTRRDSLEDSEIEYFHNINLDRDWLDEHYESKTASRELTGCALWLVGHPDNKAYEWQNCIFHLQSINQGYEVWIDWYNRRIEGRDAAFDIPGDIDRKEDKVILARLADATDEDFWGKGALYVNTTLQGWIDDARLRAELETIIRKLSDGALRQAGSVQEAECRAELVGKLAAALGTAAPEHGGMGHNFPPEGIDPDEITELPLEIRDEATAMLDELSKPEPDALAVAVTLSRWAKMKSTFQHDEFSKNFSGELGTSVAKGLVIVFLSLCSLGLLWLKALLGI